MKNATLKFGALMLSSMIACASVKAADGNHADIPTSNFTIEQREVPRTPPGTQPRDLFPLHLELVLANCIKTGKNITECVNDYDPVP